MVRWAALLLTALPLNCNEGFIEITQLQVQASDGLYAFDRWMLAVSALRPVLIIPYIR